jgi:hypothetical protein
MFTGAQRDGKYYICRQKMDATLPFCLHFVVGLQINRTRSASSLWSPAKMICKLGHSVLKNRKCNNYNIETKENSLNIRRRRKEHFHWRPAVVVTALCTTAYTLLYAVCMCVTVGPMDGRFSPKMPGFNTRPFIVISVSCFWSKHVIGCRKSENIAINK